MEYRWPAPSRAFARAFGRASHEDCCAAARDSTLRYRSCRFRAASPSQPELTELSRAAGSRERERGPLCQGGRATAERAARTRRARKDTARAKEREPEEREREKERDRLEETVTEEEKEKERQIEKGRDGDEEERGREERENEHLLRRLRVCLPCVRPSVCSDQEDELTGPSVWPFDTRCADRLANDEL